MPPQRLLQLAVPVYLLGLALLIVTAVPGVGITKKGATRWLYVGTVIQPSEIMKIAMPLMLAWWFQRREGQLRVPDFLVAGALLLVPVGLIAKQPDLGTAILVLSAGLYVIFFAGLSWKLIVPVLLLGGVAVGALVWYGDAICQPEVQWKLLREYPLLMAVARASLPVKRHAPCVGADRSAHHADDVGGPARAVGELQRGTTVLATGNGHGVHAILRPLHTEASFISCGACLDGRAC